MSDVPCSVEPVLPQLKEEVLLLRAAVKRLSKVASGLPCTTGITGHLVQMQIQIPRVGGGAWDSAFLTNSQLIMFFQVRGARFE